MKPRHCWRGTGHELDAQEGACKAALAEVNRLCVHNAGRAMWFAKSIEAYLLE